MRKPLLAISIAAFFCASLWARQPLQQPQQEPQPALVSQQPQAAEGEQAETKRVDFMAERMQNVPGTDSIILVGNVVLHHNGAVITCDSAVRYTDRKFDCFKRVIINQDSTYIYGDAAKYDGDLNIAEVFDRLVKVINGTAILYTYNFSFNTLDNIGRYWGGGIMEQDSNRLESDRGWYYSDMRDIYAAGDVEMTDPEYKLISDSVRYNMNDEVAEFYTRTYIWNHKGEILSATSGKYFHNTAQYDFTSDSYILTDDQEVWADDIKYNSATEDVEMRRNIQIRDEEQMVMAFGDYGIYWGAVEEGYLTENPSLVSFDPQEDSLFMRSDSMFVFSIPYELDYQQHYDSVRLAREMASSIENMSYLNDTLPGDVMTRDRMRAMIIAQKREQYEAGDSLRRETLTHALRDSLLAGGVVAQDIEGQLLYNEAKERSGNSDEPIGDELIQEILEKAGILRAVPLGPVETAQPHVPEGGAAEAVRAVEEQAQPLAGQPQTEGEENLPDETTGVEESETLETAETFNASEGSEEQAGSAAEQQLSEELQSQTAAAEQAIGEEEAKPLSARQQRRQEKQQQREQKQAQKRAKSQARTKEAVRPDSTQIGMSEEMLRAVADSLGLFEGVDGQFADSLAADSPAVDSLAIAADSLPVEHDSLQRILKGYYNVRIFRTDFQAVCDSLVGFSKDSTLHMYIEPVLWNGQNQVTADIIDLYTKNEQLERAVFNGSPFMSSQVDSTQYNQIKGREMEAFFRDNEIYYHKVRGNAETLYYMMDEEAGEPNAFLVINSAEIMFVIENQEMVRMTWNESPDYIVYPIDDIPLEVARFLEGFKWEAQRRPTRDSVFDRSIRPSVREEHLAMPQPRFPLTEKIEKYKKDLIDQGLWQDRIETLPPHAVEYVRTLSVE